MMVEENVPLAPLTTFRIGGPARFFVRVQNREEIRAALAFAKEKNLGVLVLGGGSNMLVKDDGFDGLVIKIELRGVELEGTTLIAAAGESWDSVVERAVREELWGLENLSGIPGTVGAAPIQNIGAYGAEIQQTLLWVEALAVESGEVIRLLNTECRFGYRTSRFKQEPENFIILRVAFLLQKNGSPNVSYKDLAGSEALSLSEIRMRIMQIRSKKFPDLSLEGTAGSFFLNPTITSKKAKELGEVYPDLPQFVVSEGVKISLAWLLDSVLHLKGLSVGGARLFEKQPLVIAASRDATAYDVRELAEKVCDLVKNKFQLQLEPEVRILK